MLPPTFKIALLIAAAAFLSGQTLPRKTTRVIWVMTDGLRWQEVFTGAEQALMSKTNHAAGEAVKQDFWRPSASERRQALMPFLWSTVAREGQIYGNRSAGSEASVTNGLNFSYPGYNESLTGAYDLRLDSNDKRNNPNITMPEWLNAKPAFAGSVAAFAAWDRFPYIFNVTRSKLTVNAGFDPFAGLPGNATINLLNTLKANSPRDWDDEPFDNLTFQTAFEYLKQRKPRFLFLSLGETDDWAHDGKYGEYLRSTRRVDDYLKLLWETVQSMPEYKGVTTLIFSTDHGRGPGEEWRAHGQKTPESKYIWMAFMGPDTPALGERRSVPTVTQNQLAATIAALLGEDYQAAVPRSGPVIADVLGSALGSALGSGTK